MANLIRSAESGSDWTTHQLAAFNIEVLPANATVFFGNPALPQTSISPTILNNLNKPAGNLSVGERDFFLYLSSLEEAGSEESRVDDFATLLLRQMRYDAVGTERLIATKREIPLIMAGQQVVAETGVCVLEGSEILLVQEDKRHGRHRRGYFEDVEPQLVAEAIAAFQSNNTKRRSKKLPMLTHKRMPGIIMIGSSVAFYLIPVTDTLERHIQQASYPLEHRTTVLRFVPPVPDSDHYWDPFNGMRPLDNRRIIFQCFEAFKQFVGNDS